MASKLITAWDTRSGKQRQVPEHWFDHEDLSANLTRTRPDVLQVAPPGVNQAPSPDARDYATADEIAAAAAAAGELRGKDLKAALKDAGLPQTGTADEQRAALVEHQERIAAADAAAGSGSTEIPVADPADGTTDSTTGDTNNNTPASGDE